MGDRRSPSDGSSQVGGPPMSATIAFPVGASEPLRHLMTQHAELGDPKQPGIVKQD